MFVCPDCGETLPARPSLCPAESSSFGNERVMPAFAFFVVAGVAITTIFLIARSLVG